MKTYKIKIHYENDTYEDIEAESEAEALKKAEDMYMDGSIEEPDWTGDITYAVDHYICTNCKKEVPVAIRLVDSKNIWHMLCLDCNDKGVKV